MQFKLHLTLFGALETCISWREQKLMDICLRRSRRFLYSQRGFTYLEKPARITPDRDQSRQSTASPSRWSTEFMVYIRL